MLSIHIRFLIHVFIVALLVPVSAHVIIVENLLIHPQGMLWLLFLVFFPYLVGVGIYPYRDDCVGIKLNHRFVRFLIAAFIPFATFLAMTFFHEDETFAYEGGIANTIVPLVFYFGIHSYFRKYWIVLFGESEPSLSLRSLSKAEQAIDNNLGKTRQEATSEELTQATIELAAESMIRNFPESKELILLSLDNRTAVISRTGIKYRARTKKDDIWHLAKNGRLNVGPIPDFCIISKTEMDKVGGDPA